MTIHRAYRRSYEIRYARCRFRCCCRLFVACLVSAARSVLPPYLRGRRTFHSNFTLAFASGEAFLGRPIPGVIPLISTRNTFSIRSPSCWRRLRLHSVLVDASQLPTTQSIAVFAIRLTNLAAYSLSTGLAFLIFLRLSKHLLLSCALTAFVLFSPQMLIIDFLRIDHIIMALFLANLLLTMMIGSSDKARKPILHVLFGAVAAALTLTKITSVLFLILPIAAYIKHVREQGVRSSGVLWFCTSFALCGLFFIVRFIPHELSQPGFTATLAFSKVSRRHGVECN